MKHTSSLWSIDIAEVANWFNSLWSDDYLCRDQNSSVSVQGSINLFCQKGKKNDNMGFRDFKTMNITHLGKQT